MKTRHLTTFALVLTAISTCLSPLPAAIITNTVSDVNDDAYSFGLTSQNWTDNAEFCGFYSGYAAPYIIGAFRFNNITVPKGTNILHAYLRVQAYASGTGSSSFTIKGEAYDSTSSFNYTPYIGERALTSAQASWSVTSAWVEDGVYTSPDIAAVVQEIVNRTGWSSGNAMAIQLQNAASSGGYQMIYSIESAATYGASPAQLIIEYVGESQPDGVKSVNYITGATNTPSLVPTYLNDPTMYYNSPGGICWATCTADIFAYWDRNPYAGVKYWNLVDNGTAPLLQPVLPAAPGHTEADVKTVITNLAHQYYGLGRSDEKAIIEEFANQTNGLAFTATYHGPVSAAADRTTFLGIIKTEINAGRPIGIGSWGTYFGGAHQIPVIGYREMSNTVNSTVYIHRNTGGTQSEYVNFYASSWGNLDMDQIVPGGTPVDEYESMGDNTAATTVSLDPDQVYNFRQTRNFSFAGDVDWMRFPTVAGRQYVINTTNLGASCDTVLSLYAADGTTQIAQNDDGGGEPRASKIVWRCWNTGTGLIRASDKVNGYGHAANYDVQMAYSAISPFLAVVSDLGGSAPPVGTNTYSYGTSVPCSLTNSPIAAGVGTQYVCTGWTMIGNTLTNGTGTNFTLALTNDATLTWRWATQFNLSVSAGAHGSVIGTNGWYNAGSVASATAVASNGWRFSGWTGDVPAVNTNDNPLTLTMNRARSASANFAILQNGLRPVISTFTLSSDRTQVIISGTNGVASGYYHVLVSANMALPLTNWTVVATNVFNGSGNFAFTNSVDPNSLRRFFLLRLP